jgi:hypothetical protein
MKYAFVGFIWSQSLKPVHLLQVILLPIKALGICDNPKRLGGL